MKEFEGLMASILAGILPFLKNKKAVFAYIVAFGKIPGAGLFPCAQRFYSRKRTNSSFFSFSRGGFYDDIPGYSLKFILKFILNSNKVYERRQ
ncbi:hypothetical protein D3H55_18115 [Bacillus salacetis]|uniref:Uncharacterized protein n=1 Tax=Bacillus salacetis TaxID=2315464 RepID=A0A3A1QRD0_9BACI|nr:hypothetical protein [Bacillus salacetis]RIW29694.1 hypothetical protein D3H55_18115 [Bacillus salacetis]